MTKPTDKKIPMQKELFYEEVKPGETTSFPFIEVQKNEAMPPSLWVFEYKHTGDVEPGQNGEEVPILDQIPHNYIDLAVLKEKLSTKLFDQVRVALGMLPLQDAKKLGQEKLDKVMAKVESIKEEILKKREHEKNS